MGSEPAIRVENLGKKYQLAHGQPRGGYRTVRESVSGLFCRRPAGTTEEFWALADVSFEVQPGEVVGVIGRNGAGKSTLLKILSRITKPTTGRVELNGRVGSLLEVGTGFHPELTGRENVFLNGSILGMSRREIARKFDEIVAFSEVEKFLDTPVKRYSSGMYVRLAFAVAARLQPEILIVDEVLAVGDAGFQKKCMGKMGEVAAQGRTVFFVSHSIQAINQLTTTVVYFENGRVAFRGDTATGVAKYVGTQVGDAPLGRPFAVAPVADRTHVAAARVVTSDANGEHVHGRPLAFEFDVHLDRPRQALCFSFQVVDDTGRPACHFWLLDRGLEFDRGGTVYRLRCEVPKCRLYMGRYTLTTYLNDRRSGEVLEVLPEIAPFEVSMRGIVREEYEWQRGSMVYWEESEWEPIEKQPAAAADGDR